MSMRAIPLVAIICGLLTIPGYLPPAQGQPTAKELIPTESTWKVKVDYKQDGELKGQLNEVTWKFTARNNRLIVTEQGHAETNPTRLVGEIVDGKVPVMTLRHDGFHGYVSCWLGKVASEGHIVGIWFDNQGNAGDFEISLEKKK